MSWLIVHIVCARGDLYIWFQQLTPEIGCIYSSIKCLQIFSCSKLIQKNLYAYFKVSIHISSLPIYKFIEQPTLVDFEMR